MSDLIIREVIDASKVLEFNVYPIEHNDMMALFTIGEKD